MYFSNANNKIDLNIHHLYVAGWTGRDKDAVDHHIRELAELGIAPPSKIPLYYRITNELLTQKDHIEVLGKTTSGEAEPLLIQHDGQIWIGLASDHTDRELEAYSVAASKQACLKPVSHDIWSFDTVKEHLDSVILRCHIEENGQWVTYQEGTLKNITPLSELMIGANFRNNTAMLCGTLPAIGGVRPAENYRIEMVDPVLEREIQLDYSVVSLPIVS